MGKRYLTFTLFYVTARSSAMRVFLQAEFTSLGPVTTELVAKVRMAIAARIALSYLPGGVSVQLCAPHRIHGSWVYASLIPSAISLGSRAVSLPLN